MAGTLMKLLLLGILLPLTACQAIGTRTNAIDQKTIDAIRRDICTRAWLGVTTSRHDVLTEQTKIEIQQDTVARASYCRGILK